jgi:hypothetical protein
VGSRQWWKGRGQRNEKLKMKNREMKKGIQKQNVE